MVNARGQARIVNILERYTDLPMDYADATLPVSQIPSSREKLRTLGRQ